MSEWAARRFWTAASVVSDGSGYTIALDGRPVKTPAKRLLTVPTEALASRIAAEWDAQDESIAPDTMPLTRMANSALDKVAVQRGEVIGMLAAYGDADLLCYRAEAPAELVARQQARWDPLLDWAAQRYGARLVPRAGIMHMPQDDAALASLADAVHPLSDFELAAFHDLVTLTGSLVLALAAADGANAPEALWDLSRLDEDWQSELWGADEEAAEVAARKRADFLCAAEAFALART